MAGSGERGTDVYRPLGYIVLFVYAMMVASQVLTFYRISSPDWHLLDWLIILFVVTLMPGVPGLLLVVPAKFLRSRIATACQFLGAFGTMIAIVWGFIFSLEWFLVAGLAVVLNVVAYKIKSNQGAVI